MSDRVPKLLRLLEADPRDAFVLYALGQEMRARGEHDRAIAFYDRLLSVEPDHPYAFFFKARSLAAVGRLDEAKAAADAGVTAAARRGDEKGQSELAGLRAELDLL